MPVEDFIINIYLMVDEYYKKVVNFPLRQGGFAPKLTDQEIITMEIVGEFLQMDTDVQIWHYFSQHWLHLFPQLGSKANFSKQCANLWHIKELIQNKFYQEQQTDNIHFCDGFPIAVCHLARSKKHKNFIADASYGYCASKKERYYGFKGHLLISHDGMINRFTFSQANIDEREVVPELIENIQGFLGADKGLICPKLKAYCLSQGIDLQTPLRKNMRDDRPKEFVKSLLNARRKIETVIGQLSAQFNIQKVRAKDLWHLSHRCIRKILAHNFCFVLN